MDSNWLCQLKLYSKSFCSLSNNLNQSYFEELEQDYTFFLVVLSDKTIQLDRNILPSTALEINNNVGKEELCKKGVNNLLKEDNFLGFANCITQLKSTPCGIILDYSIQNYCIDSFNL